MALWTPAEIATALWLDAADSSTLFDAVSGGSLPANGAGVARWEDKSGNGRHAIQGVAERRPTRRSAILNGLDVVRFDGSNDILTAAASSPTFSGYQLLAVEIHTDFGRFNAGRIVEVGNNQLLTFVNGNVQSYRHLSGSLADPPNNSGTINTWRLLAVSDQLNSSASGIRYVIDGSPLTNALLYNATSTIPSPGNAIHIGNRPALDRGFTGDFAEILLFNSVLSMADRQLTEGYLAWKWGLQNNLPANHPYKNAAPTIAGGLSIIIASHHAALGI